MYRLAVNGKKICVIDIAGDLHGRGAYVCEGPKCKESPQLLRRAKYALRAPVDIENSEDLTLLR